jgi:hypothetical protein
LAQDDDDLCIRVDRGGRGRDPGTADVETEAETGEVKILGVGLWMEEGGRGEDRTGAE